MWRGGISSAVHIKSYFEKETGSETARREDISVFVGQGEVVGEFSPERDCLKKGQREEKSRAFKSFKD